MRIALLLLLTLTASAEENLVELAAKVKHYPSKFKLIAVGRPAVKPLMDQIRTSEDEWLRFESMSAVRWIVSHSKERKALASDLTAYLGAAPVFVAELLGDLGQAQSIGSLTPLLAGEHALAAVDALRRIPGSTDALVSNLNGVSEKVRDEIYRALGERGDRKALPALEDGAARKHTAAILALGAMGDLRAVGTLSKVRTKESFAALVMIAGKNGDGVLLWQLYGGADSDAQRLDVIGTAGRTAPFEIRLVEMLTKATETEALRVPAQHALLGILERTDPATAAPLVRSLAAEAKDRTVLVRALAGCGRCRDQQAVSLVVKHMASADTNVKTTALAALRAIPGEQAEAALCAACGREADPAVQVMLITALGERGGATAAKEIEQWLKEGPDGVRKAAVNAYVSIADRLPADRAVAAYMKALGAMENRAAVRGLGRVGDEKAAAFLAQREVGDESRAAIMAIGRRLATAGNKAAAITAFKHGLAAGAPVESDLRRLGEAVTITARGGVVSDWWVTGPFDAPTVASWANKEFPEDGVTLDERWQPVSGGADGIVDLNSMYSKNDLVTAYAYAVIVSKKEREVVLKCGSDDGIRVWVNGELVHDNPALRGVSVGEDSVKIKLKAGANALLVKACEKGGGWGFCVMLETTKGRPLKFQIR